ncbi:retrovirus-related pol polyprotein from transposon TNT 1-94 [Tanacetum coccineum]
MTTLADKAILSGADNRPPMLEKDMYDSWKSIMELYMLNRQHGRMILESVENGPLIWPSIEENGVTRPKKYSELSATEAIQADCDIKATNIILQGLPPEVYALVSNHKVAKELWERIQLLMQGTSLTKQERECKLYDEFDKFAYKKGETLRDFYLRFSLLLNDMNIYNMKLEQFQVNTKFLNTLPPEWSKFVTDVKLVRDLHTTNIDQLHAYLGQHEFHANEVRLMHERNSDLLALSPQCGSPYQQYSNNQSSTPLSITYPSNDYQSSIHHNVYSPSSSIRKLEYAPLINQQPEFSQQDSGLIVLVFQNGDDPIDAINHMMSFLTAVITSRCPTTNNQLRNSSNPRQQTNTFNIGRTVIRYNCKGEGHMSKQCTKPKRKRDDSWFKDKVLLVQSQASGQILHEEELAFLADLGIPEVALMVNLSHYGLDALAESVEIDRLKQTLSEHLKEKESLMQTVTLLKNDFKKEESRNIDGEIALEKRIKQLDNIKAQQLEPKLYDGNVIKNTSAIVIPDSEETLLLAKESRSKMLLKQQDPMMLEKKGNTTLNSSRPTKVEVPKELPKVSMVNTSLKKLKHNLAGFDVVFKERTTPTAITEGSWGFEQTKAYFRDEIIPFSQKHLKLNDQVLNENERLLEQVISKDIVNTIVNSSVDIASVNVHECEKCLKLKTELLNKKDFVEKEIFQRNNFVSNQSAPSFDQLFELNELKDQSQEKDTVIKKLKERIKSLSGKMNEHLKQTYKQLYDSIKPARIRSKEQCDDLINQVNLKSVEISDLNASLREKVLVITYLKDDLRKLKGKALVDSDVTKHHSDPEMLKIDVEPITPKLLNKKIAHSAYIKHTQEEATVRKDLVEYVKSKYPLDHSLESVCRYAKLIQELLTHISKTCPSINNTDGKLVVVTPKNKDKKVRFTKPITSSGYTITKTASTSNLVSNKPMSSSTGVKPSTSACGSQPSGNTKKDKNRQTPSSTQKNKVEAHPRKVESSLKNKDCVVKPKGTAYMQHSKLNANSELKCVKCNGCMLSDNHDLCVLDFINNVNARNKSKSVKQSSKRKVVQIVLWYLDFGCSKHMIGDRSQLTNFVNNILCTVKFRNDHVAKILGYGDYHIGNVTISRVYYVEGLGHNLFFVGKFCDSNLEVAFRQHTCFIQNFEGVDLLTRSRGNNLYTLSLGDMMTSSPICLLSKASKTKFWLWHQCLSHLNFGAINHLARHGLVRGLPKLKFEKDHMCSACAMGKSKKKPHKPKSKDTNQEKLYLLHMDLCRPMRVASVNGKKYNLVIVDNYSRFTWVKCLRSKDEALDFIIKFLKMIQVRPKVLV